ncbi:MAG TPA: ATP-binding protein [Xanthobacteraceae bacterium]|nr:ATP-binding protein [Xanthobacteraceae bacterium]
MKGSFSVRLPEFARTTTFRWTLAISGAFTLCVILMFVFVLGEEYSYLSSDVDRLNSENARLVTAETKENRVRRLNEYLQNDPRRVKLGGLFDSDGNRIAGNIENLPATLQTDSSPTDVSLIRVDAFGRDRQLARTIAHRLDDRSILVVGRNVQQFTWIVGVVRRALTLGLIPALCLGLMAGALLSVRGQKRIDAVNRKVQRIVDGELRERLPTRGTNDPFDKLAVLVNGMLDEIESLVRRLAGVGDDIAHDLRTPLTHVRVSLERARQKAGSLDELRASVDKAIVGLDQSLAIITALLRIAEIEHSRQVDGFRDVALADLVREVGDLYEPIAEDKKVDFAVKAKEDATVHGDRDLLFEAVANLVDNAVKFTPQGGHVELSLLRKGNEAVVRVCDSGPGIPIGESDLVMRRFYRSDKSRCDPGLGLGLSLVNAIVKLHGFDFRISSGPGCVAEIAGRSADA